MLLDFGILIIRMQVGLMYLGAVIIERKWYRKEVDLIITSTIYCLPLITFQKKTYFQSTLLISNIYFAAL